VPPDAATVALPLHWPLHVTLVEEVIDDVNAVGCVIVTDAVALQPALSVTVTLYVPAVKLFAVAPELPEGDHAYVYGVVPPDGVTVALPLFPPLQDTFVLEEILADKVLISLTFAVAVFVQLFASVTVTV
jgi:hypothetical protein